MMRKLKKIGVLAAILVSMSLAVSACTPKKIDPYNMNETEALVWLKENNITVPPELKDAQIGKLVINVAKGHQAGLDMSLPISYQVTAEFIREIQNHLP